MRPAADMTLDDYPLEDPRLVPERPTRKTISAEPMPVPDLRNVPVSTSVRDRLVDNERLVLSSARDMVSREQYRRLAASLHEAQVERGLKTLVVTSALPREGKTLTTINLALTLSESYGRRVLLIDADLRRPSVHDVLGIANTKGLSEVLHVDQAVLPTVAISETFDVLTSGKPDQEPLAGLSSQRMRRLLEYVSSQYDWVILDTPPIALLSDAQLVAGLTQAVIFVIRAGSTPFPIINRALDALGREIVIGTVLNGVEQHPGNSEYGDYYGQTPVR